MKAHAKRDSEGNVVLSLRLFRHGGDTFVPMTNAEASTLRDSLTAVLAEGDNRV